MIYQRLISKEHPSAHYINLRTMEIYEELFNIGKRIYKESEPITDFQYYRYMRRLLSPNNLYGLTNQFEPGNSIHSSK